ncbi:ATP-binding protein [Spirosoma foliorum]|uniref:ATP-binding protein n=1 Tax=Spirosoma foliorum TaxID=2710596 RepID=A0A7G5GSC2_9BACT|nr:ATP-binding protein [Spirosoma foliorum]QMW01764.1 ATP-binding protein [Spirosoma foliorum]
MIERALYSDLEAHLTKKQATVIVGMRRVGKTTALRHLLAKVPHTNKLFLDLEKAENRYLLNQPMYRDIELDLQIQGIDLSKPAVIAIDEIQLVKNSPSVIKYLYDTYSIKFLLTGSSSYYLKNHFSESLAGRKRIFEMFPLSFPEYVAFFDDDTRIINQFARQPFNQTYYLKYKALYEAYLQFGGFPEVALAETDDDRKSYLSDIINAYIELDIRLLSDFSVSDDLVRLVRLVAAHTGSKLDYQKIGSLMGISRHKIKDYLMLLEHTYFIQTVSAFSRSTDRDIAQQRKIYVADTGLLNQLAKVSGGQLFENAIANQLHWLGTVQFYQRKSGQEIDFILNEQIAVEVKETPTPSDLKTLQKRATSIGLTETILVSRHPAPGDFKDFVWGGNLVNLPGTSIH